jgi:hypothetical protein
MPGVALAPEANPPVRPGPRAAQAQAVHPERRVARAPRARAQPERVQPAASAVVLVVARVLVLMVAGVVLPLLVARVVVLVVAGVVLLLLVARVVVLVVAGVVVVVLLLAPVVARVVPAVPDPRARTIRSGRRSSALPASAWVMPGLAQGPGPQVLPVLPTTPIR